KALRSPAKDTLLSIYTSGMGRGLVFGIHETADQIGAVLGPLIFFALLYYSVGYKTSFLVLFIPYLLMIISLFLAKRYTSYVTPESKASPQKSNIQFKSSILIYLIFIFLTSVGFIGFPLISFHGVKVGLVEEKWVPFLYSLVMVMDSLVAIPVGVLYDKIGVRIMTLLPFITLVIVFGAFSNNLIFFLVSLGLWGIVMSIYETIVRAFIGDNVPVSDRGKYYGIFNTVLGLSFMLGNTIAGYLYDIQIKYIIYFVSVFEVLSLIPIIVLLYKSRDNFKKV
ncbi:MAG: MFS transporter, partial [Brevinematia bacterium]